MSDNKKNPEILTSSLDLNQEKLADKEKNERVQEIVDTKNNKDIDNKINEIETVSDTLVTNEQMKKELWAHKVEAEMTAREKIKEKWGETAERAKRNWWLIVWWVGSFFGIRRLWKKIKWNETTETSNSTNSTETKDNKGNTVINVDATPKKNWFQRNWGWLVWGAWVVGAWVYFKDKLHKIPVIGTWLDKLFNAPEVSFEDSFTNFKSDINRWDVEKQFGINSNISYEKIDDKKMKLKSYTKEIVIDIEKRIIEWMEDIVFPNFSELLHAANIINFSAASFQWVCRTNKPFNITKSGWDIEVQLLDKWNEEVVSGAGIPIGKIAGWTTAVLTTILWAVYGWWLPWGLAWAWVWVWAVWLGHMADSSDALSQYCPTLNTDANKEKFRARLNKIPNLTQWKQDVRTVTESELKTDIQRIIAEIEGTEIDDEDREYTDHWNERVLNAIPVRDVVDTYDITSWNNVCRVVYKNGKITIPELGNLVFDKDEGIRVANLTNKLKKLYMGKSWSKAPFVYRGSVMTGGHEGLYVDKEWFDIWGERILSKETLDKRYPLLSKHIESHYIPYLHKMKDENNNKIREAA